MEEMNETVSPPVLSAVLPPCQLWLNWPRDPDRVVAAVTRQLDKEVRDHLFPAG